MTEPRKRRSRDPVATRADILEAACTLLAKDGPEGISLSEVAKLAGINRGTAYQHFETREKLIEATTEWVSDKMFRAVFGDPETLGERNVGEVDIASLTDRLHMFAMDNPELCRIWLLQLLSSPEPSRDPFWREYEGSLARFAATEFAQPGIDTEALSVLNLAGAFLWPVWARSHAHGDDDRRSLAVRFSQEALRLSMYGSLQSENYPLIAERLGRAPKVPVKLRAVGG
ncbi:TetR/AcrR family transcriptional regulator [Sphingomonas sp. SUN039]|uniref:TetR/AcrR family transcriptional regulator n=1 Tax=Sphingomonas sp. SUN039 TaxID=2937787 RepID=UPI002164B1EC|nr:TetR/AcrR family transcriptional regulator [Sphingomonas sp. SUN039]UVO52656.1 TetR/AcrR family transcriptional regulator [Sphingomonas sp. SUN039]